MNLVDVHLIKSDESIFHVFPTQLAEWMSNKIAFNFNIYIQSLRESLT